MRIARRRGVGTLLIVVLVVLASLFVMAMMQYFASFVTKGKRILAHIAVTDYACEAALDEAVLWFKGHANDPKDKEAQKLHEKLVSDGTDDASTTFKPQKTIDLYKKLHKDLEIKEVTVSISDVNKLIEEPGELAGKKFYETEGIVNFAVTCSYESTKKTAVRSLEFRQVVVAPPQDYSKYQFVATSMGYLGRRVKKYVDDQSRFAQASAKAAERVYFGFSMLTYIADPGNAAVGGGNNFMVGLNFIKNVKQAALKLSPSGWDDASVRQKLEDGMCCSKDTSKCPQEQCEGLRMWEKTYKNPNFNVEYISAMANADTSNLTKVLDQMKGDEFGFKPGDGGPLGAGDDYPLSPKTKDGQGGEKTSQVLGGGAGYGFKPAQKWGVGGKLEGSMFKQADIKFQSATGGSISLDDFVTRFKEEPVVVVDKQQGPWKLSEIEFFIHPPPVRPPEKREVPQDLKGEAGVEGIDAHATVTEDDLAQMDAAGGDAKVLSDFAGADWKSKFGDMGADADASKYEMPSLSLWHPKSYEDWAFRFPKSFWQNNFSKHGEAFTKWKDATVGNSKFYREKMEKENADVVKKLKLIEPKAGGTTPAVAALPGAEKLSKRASYIFPTPKDFDDAMKALSTAANTNNALVMNGVYYIGKPPEPTQPGQQPASQPGTKDPVTITQGEYVGQGELVANHLILQNGMKQVQGKGIGMVLHSAAEDEPFEINSPNQIDASIVTGAVLKAKASATVKGVFVVKDAFCVNAAKSADAKDEKKEVSYYYWKMPELTIEHPGYANPPVEYSQMTFSSYRTSSGGVRGGK